MMRQGGLHKRNTVMMRGCCCNERAWNCEFLVEMLIHANNFPVDSLGAYPRPDWSMIRSQPMCIRHVVWGGRFLTDGTFQDVITTYDHDFVIRNAWLFCEIGKEYVHNPYRPVFWEGCLDANPAESLRSDVDLSILNAFGCTVKEISPSLPFFPQVGGSVTWESIINIMDFGAEENRAYTFVMLVETSKWNTRKGRNETIRFGTSSLRLKLWRIQTETFVDPEVYASIGKCE